MTLPCVFVLDNDYTMYISWYMNCEYHMNNTFYFWLCHPYKKSTIKLMLLDGNAFVFTLYSKILPRILLCMSKNPV